MKLLTINYTHDASVCLLEDGEILFYAKEERFSRRKRDPVPYHVLLRLREAGLLRDLDEIVLCNWQSCSEDWGYTAYYERLRDHLAPGSRVSAVWGQHHVFHAYNAFYGSGFEEALVIVVDTAGAVLRADGTTEKESVYLFQREGLRELYRHLSTDALSVDGSPRRVKHGICDRYDGVTRRLGLDILEAGKTMGLASYGRRGAAVPGDLPVPSRITRESFQPYADLAFAVQEATSAEVLALIRTWVERTGVHRVCITGGYGMNSVANQRYLRELGGEVELYPDPLADDGGISLGMARMLGGGSGAPLASLAFSGFRYDLDGVGEADATAEDVVARLLDGQVGALFQGHAEAGARALGHRSLLFDPRVENGMEIVNRVKRREWYRPFAATVLQEQAHDWFDLGPLTESPFMTYVFPVHQERAAAIPAVLHVDGTCRAQTLRRNQDPLFYDLIAAFYRETGVPMLLNTSFNLSGEPLVETPEQALRTLRESALDFIYFPEAGRLLSA